MKKYKIKIYNDSDVIVADEEIPAPNENEALTYILKNIILYSGDTIKIEEME